MNKKSLKIYKLKFRIKNYSLSNLIIILFHNTQNFNYLEDICEKR